MLQPARMREDGRAGLAVSDFFDFSVYVDASRTDIRQWYTERFLRLRETAFRDPDVVLQQYADLTDDQAVAEAARIWDTINGPNLARNIAPTRSAGHPGAAQGRRPLGQLGPAAEALRRGSAMIHMQLRVPRTCPTRSSRCCRRTTASPTWPSSRVPSASPRAAW